MITKSVVLILESLANSLKILEQQVATFCDAEKDQNTYVANSDIEDVNAKENIISEYEDDMNKV